MSSLKTIVFDLDETLYPTGTGVIQQVKTQIHQFAAQVTGLPFGSAASLCEGYYHTYGTTLGGLQRHYAIDHEAYLDRIHDFDVAVYLQPDHQLKAMLARLPQRKIILTNSPREFAERVLAALDVASHFDLILDVHACDYIPKPAAGPYQRLCANLQHPADQALFIDDRLVNLPPAAAYGVHTVWLSPLGVPDPRAHHTITDIYALETLLGYPQAKV